MSCNGLPAELLAGARAVHHDRDAQRVQPRDLGRHQRQPGGHGRGDGDARARDGDGVPAERVRQVGGGDRAGAGEVVDAGLALPAHGGGERERDVVGVDELERGARVGQHGADGRLAQQRRERLDQRQRVAAGDDAGAEHVGLGVRAVERLAQRRLELGLLGGVVVRVGAAHRDVLGQRLRVVGVEAVGGDGGGVDEPAHVARGLEDVARALEVDRARLLAPADDDEREVHEHVGLGRERAHGVAVEHVALRVLGLLEPERAGVEGPPRHAEHLRHERVRVEPAQQRAADVAGGPGDGDDHS